MALTRFNGNVVPFASESTTDNRTVFGDVVQADDIDSNLNADFKKGWEIVGLNDNPTKQDFNAMGYTLGALTSYLYQMGIAEYNASQEYKLNAVCIGTDGTIYQSLVDANIGNALNDVSKWKKALDTANFVDLVNNQSIDGIKTFSSNPISSATQSTAVNALTRKDYVDGLNSTNVKLTGNQTIAGVKTFSSSPIVPTPTTGTQAVNKDYADLKVALSDFTGANQSLNSNGYQKLPGGLIIQWGTTDTLAQNATIVVNLPIAFPTAFLNASASYGSDPVNSSTTAALAVLKTSLTQLSITKGVNGGGAENLLTTQWIAIGK